MPHCNSSVRTEETDSDMSNAHIYRALFAMAVGTVGTAEARIALDHGKSKKYAVVYGIIAGVTWPYMVMSRGYDALVNAGRNDRLVRD